MCVCCLFCYRKFFFLKWIEQAHQNKSTFFPFFLRLNGEISNISVHCLPCKHIFFFRGKQLCMRKRESERDEKRKRKKNHTRSYTISSACNRIRSNQKMGACIFYHKRPLFRISLNGHFQ